MMNGDRYIEALGHRARPTRLGENLVVRNKYLMRERTALSTSGEEELLSVSHITGVSPRRELKVNMFEAETNVGYKRVDVGDLVINTLWGWMGALGVSEHEGIVSPAYGVYRMDRSRLVPKFAHYLYRSRAYVGVIGAHSKGVWSSRLRIYPEDFLALKSPCPPLDVQERIVHELDAATRQVDRAISVMSRERELLEAVLDRCCSDVLGDEPLGPAVKHCCRGITSGPRGWSEYINPEGDTPFIRIANIQRRSVVPDLTDLAQVTAPHGPERTRSTAQVGDSLVSITADIGSTTKVTPDISGAVVSQHVALVRHDPNKTVGGWIAYALRDTRVRDQLRARQYGGTKQQLSLRDVADVRIAVPTIDVQEKLVTRIEERSRAAAAAVEKLSGALERLVELRENVVTRAVFGMTPVTARADLAEVAS